MPSDKSKDRKRIVVEEVGGPPSEESAEKTETTEPAETPQHPSEEMMAPLEEVKEKVEELQTITEEIAESVDKSAEVQEEIAEAAEKVVSSISPEESKPEVMAPPQPISQNRIPSPLIVLIPGLLILGAILGGVYFYQNGVKTEEEATPTPSVEASATPVATATPAVGKLDLTKYSINIENGVGIPGTAATAKDVVTKAGFKVTTTGNADNYEYTDTVIQVKSTVPAEYVTKLTTALGAKYKVSATTKTLEASAKTDVVIIIGSSKP